jgi:hypothetical protein
MESAVCAAAGAAIAMAAKRQIMRIIPIRVEQLLQKKTRYITGA